MAKILLLIIPLGMLNDCFNLPVASTGKVTVLNSLARAAIVFHAINSASHVK